ncbi:hypothetical protein CCGE531_25440 (plasmid) [Rhizobium sp. CCGE531]|nr:hypothetical protein CCGE531_25440 [Rhizobium sp. CCGE531]AYG75749.1 hypothetical protein CCGE532_24955 [Rhizobium sp. CCGE532]
MEHVSYGQAVALSAATLRRIWSIDQLNFLGNDGQTHGNPESKLEYDSNSLAVINTERMEGRRFESSPVRFRSH